MSEDADKDSWRVRVAAVRERMRPDQLSTAATSLTRHLRDRLTGLSRIAAYVPVGTEPGSVDLLEMLRVGGTTILLPVTRPADLLDWAVYEGPQRLSRGRFGLREPVGARLGIAALADVELVLAPALAVARDGTRLGRGAGYYDRALAHVDPALPVVALLHDGELVASLPADPWDRRMSAAVTPRTGWTELPPVAHHIG